MGRDKALLPLGPSTLVEQIAARVRAAAGNVTIIGPIERYRHLDIQVIEDLIPDSGPMGGLYTALKTTSADWNLVVACDMPGLEVRFLTAMLAAAPGCGSLALVPYSDRGWEPLCAVYHRDLISQIDRSLSHKAFKMQEFVAEIRAKPWPVSNSALLSNVNTLEDWQVHT